MADITASFAPITPVAAARPSVDFAQAAADITAAGSVTAPAPDDVNPTGFARVRDHKAPVEDPANTAAVDLATGKLENPHEFTALAAQAQLTVELSAAVRNRAVDAFNEVMRMQV